MLYKVVYWLAELGNQLVHYLPVHYSLFIILNDALTRTQVRQTGQVLQYRSKPEHREIAMSFRHKINSTRDYRRAGYRGTYMRYAQWTMDKREISLSCRFYTHFWASLYACVYVVCACTLKARKQRIALFVQNSQVDGFHPIADVGLINPCNILAIDLRTFVTPC